MVKYLIIAATIFFAGACKIDTSRRKMICMPETGMIAGTNTGSSLKEYATRQEESKLKKEPLMLLRILTEF